MDAAESAQRAAVVAEARSWIGTPYHHAAGIKGIGVDCLYLLARVFEGAGLIERPKIPHYPPDWHLHRDAERYMMGLVAYAREVPGPPERAPLPGDIVLWKFGRCFSHGAIVTAWPTVVHAYLRTGVASADVVADTWLVHVGEHTEEHGKLRPRRFFSYWERSHESQ